MPCRRARSGCSSAPGPGSAAVSDLHPPGLVAALVLLHVAAGGQHVRVAAGPASRPGRGARPARNAARPSGGREAVGEQPRRARVVLGRARPEDALLGLDPLVGDAGVVGDPAGAGPAQLVEDLARLGGEVLAAAEPVGQVGQHLQVGAHLRAAAAAPVGGGSPGPRGWSSCPPPRPTGRSAGRRRRARRVSEQEDVGDDQQVQGAAAGPAPGCCPARETTMLVARTSSTRTPPSVPSRSSISNADSPGRGSSSGSMPQTAATWARAAGSSSLR